ncbi:MAG: uracil-DNA glycosylase [Armatimonadetes bacterium]|nr:uracil-DNA glycosylase [Armatimonadota bacterium]
MQEEHPPLRALAEEIAGCARCPRLAAYLAEGRQRHPDYWGHPVPGYGDPGARLVILGLAPGFHGANRHGRVFCGDDSGRWLWSALHELGLCSHPRAADWYSPLVLRGVYVSNAVRCAPPQNRPVAAELAACRAFLRRELSLLPEARVVLALGHLAHNTFLRLRGQRLSGFAFRHGAAHEVDGGPPLMVDSYHPSRQNTHTGRLTWEMWLSALRAAAQAAGMGH